MNKTLARIAAATGAAIILSMSSGTALAGGFLDVSFEDAVFSTPQILDNEYWPLNPDGETRTFTYEAETEDGCVINKIYINGGPVGGPSTDPLGKELTGDYALMGPVLEVLDIEWVDEECDDNLVRTELTFDWYAQDKFGNIWYMGEYSRNFEEYAEGMVCPPYVSQADVVDAACTEGSWEAGIIAGEGEDAVTGEPGIVVPSDLPFGPDGEPLSTGTYYFQEVAYEAEDMAKVLRQQASLSVEEGVLPGGYENCRKVKEWNPFEPGESVEHKWYCHDSTSYGPGLVLIEGIGGGITEVETLTVIDPEF